MTVTAVVCAHGPGSQVADIVGQLHGQTAPPAEIRVYASDVPQHVLDSLDAVVTVVENRNDWGHEKRAQGLAEATGEWVGFFNDDDLYDPDYLRQMVEAAAGYDLVMCSWNERGGPVIHPKPVLNHVTAGNFLVNRRAAQQVGWNGRKYESDGYFIQDLVAAGATWTVVDRVLYWHR